MKEYILVENKDGDQFEKYFQTKEEGIEGGERAFSYLTKCDKKHIQDFYLMKTVNPDPESENHFDGDIIKRWI